MNLRVDIREDIKRYHHDDILHQYYFTISIPLFWLIFDDVTVMLSLIVLS